MHATRFNSPFCPHPWLLRPAWALLVLLPFLSQTTLGGEFGGGQEGDFTFDGSGAVTGYAGPGGAVVIPDSLGNKPVTAIGDIAFYGRNNLTSVIIPNGVTSIGDWAFQS